MLDFLVTPSEREQIIRIIRLPMRKKFRLAWGLRHDDRMTSLMTAPLLAAIAYVLLPVNILPRRLPILRTFDDLIVAATALLLFVKLAPAGVLDEHLRRLDG